MSGNVEDRRSMRPWFIGGGSIFGVLLLLYILGVNPLRLLGLYKLDRAIEYAADYQPSEKDDKLVEFTSVVLASTEDVWGKLFQDMGKTYVQPRLVVYHRFISSACGMASSATGPFYCPEDKVVYIDVSFYDELVQRHKAGGEFAFAYVIAHEVGHHVQKLLGTLDKENALRMQSDEKESNAISVRIELQADFYAGVWAHHAKDMFRLSDEDIRQALDTAAAIGDDRIQKESQGHVVPDAFTHGTSEQRQRWFFKGYETGDMKAGDTFHADEL